MGELNNELRSGKGIYYYATGDVYAGQWANDLFDGDGNYIFASGERY